MSGPRFFALASALMLTAGCTSSTAPGGGGGGGATCTGSNAAVSVCDNKFAPTSSTITAGTSITWTWKGSNSHNVTFQSGSLSGTGSATMAAGTFTQLFAAPGVYTYECTIHGAVMSGTVTVN